MAEGSMHGTPLGPAPACTGALEQRVPPLAADADGRGAGPQDGGPGARRHPGERPPQGAEGVEPRVRLCGAAGEWHRGGARDESPQSVGGTQALCCWQCRSRAHLRPPCLRAHGPSMPPFASPLSPCCPPGHPLHRHHRARGAGVLGAPAPGGKHWLAAGGHAPPMHRLWWQRPQQGKRVHPW